MENNDGQRRSTPRPSSKKQGQAGGPNNWSIAVPGAMGSITQTVMLLSEGKIKVEEEKNAVRRLLMDIQRDSGVIM